jgi:hypothetical protein
MLRYLKGKMSDPPLSLWVFDAIAEGIFKFNRLDGVDISLTHSTKLGLN